MKASEKKFIALTLFAVLFAAAVSFGGGCGGSSDSDPKDIHVIGKLHGDYADELTALYDVMAPDGDPDSPVIVSRESGLNLTDEEALLLKKYLMAGQAVGIEHASEKEVNEFLDKLGFKTDDSIAPDDTHYEYYGIKVIGDDVFSYVVPVDDAPEGEETPYCPDTIMSGDTPVSQDFTPDLPDGAEIVESGDKLIVTYNGQTEELDKYPPHKADSSRGNIDFSIADSMVDWMYDNKNQAEYARSAKKKLMNEQKSGKLRGVSAPVDLKDVSSLYQRTFDASIWKYDFKITTDIYSCHVYNLAEKDGSSGDPESDWFFVKQSSMLNPSKEYQLSDHNGNARALADKYIVSYVFENTPVTQKGKSIPEIVLKQCKPDTSVGSRGFSSGISVSLGGNIGFSGLGGAGGISGNVNYSTTESQTVPDAQVTAYSPIGNNGTKWVYSFSRPIPYGGPYFTACANNLHDAPAAARALFQPVNQWAWEIPNSIRGKATGFKMKFKFTRGYSYSERFVLWIRSDKAEHGNYPEITKDFYVPFGVYPPLISGADIDFKSAGGDSKLDIMCMRDWSAESNSSWCRIIDKTIDGDDGSLKVSGTQSTTGNFKIQVEPNDTGKNRTAYITLRTQDGKGKTRVKIFQSKY